MAVPANRPKACVGESQHAAQGRKISAARILKRKMTEMDWATLIVGMMTGQWRQLPNRHRWKSRLRSRSRYFSVNEGLYITQKQRPDVVMVEIMMGSLIVCLDREFLLNSIPNQENHRILKDLFER